MHQRIELNFLPYFSHIYFERRVRNVAEEPQLSNSGQELSDLLVYFFGSLSDLHFGLNFIHDLIDGLGFLYFLYYSFVGGLECLPEDIHDWSVDTLEAACL